MSYLLNLAYLVLLVVASPYLVFQGLRKGKYREGFAEKFLGRVPRRPSDRPCVWLHAVSVGEVNLLLPVVERLSCRHPEWECVISTTTMTGMALARKKFPQHVVFYCPLDFSWAVRQALARIRPKLLVLAELELWPNLISAAKAAGARVAVINGRLGERSFRGYRRIGWLARRLLAQVDLVAAQDESYAQRFRALGAPERAVVVTGSIKYDGAKTDRANPATARLRQLAGFASQDLVFLAGSTQEPEEALALDAFRALAPQCPELRLVLVPRHPDRFENVARLLDQSGLRWQRRTALERAPVNLLARILLVDVVGELGAWWGAADIAFVGGSLGRRGGQNMIEPAAYGAAVSFGPNTWNFRDIVSLMLAHRAADVVTDGKGLTAFVRRCLEDRPSALEMGRRAQSLVISQQGATDRTVSLLEPLVAGVG